MLAQALTVLELHTGACLNPGQILGGLTELEAYNVVGGD
jgi:hypothetical protein